MATETTLGRKALPLQITLLLFLSLTLANPAGISLGQARYVLIAEKIEKPGKIKAFSEGDKLTLRSYKTGNRYTDRITAFSDSSLVLDANEFLFSEIQFVEGRVKVPDTQKKIGWVLMSASLVITVFNSWSFSEGDDYVPLALIGPSLAIFSVCLSVTS